MSAAVVNSRKASMIWAPPSDLQRLLQPPGMHSMTLMPSWTRCWRNSQPWRARSQPIRTKAALAGATLRKAILAIWCLCFCSGAPLDSSRHPIQHAVHRVFPLDPAWSVASPARPAAPDMACGDNAVPSAVVIESPLSLSASGQLSGERSCKSAPSCSECGFDGGKKIRSLKVHLGVEKYGIPLAINVSLVNTHGP
jgi:hypothetical protein